ncbi:MAG: hypothetical protein QMB24_13370 [Spirosomataceae bacterium]
MTNPASTKPAVFFSDGPAPNANDGARCATAPLCRVGAVSPNLSQASAVNTCSSNSINLANISANNTPYGTVLTRHTGIPTITCESPASTSVTITVNPPHQLLLQVVHNE